MPNLTDVIVEDERWIGANLPALAEKAAVQTFKAANIASDGREICVMGCNDVRIAELNTEFREKETATNVLSWPAYEVTPSTVGQFPDDGGDSFGDIAIAFETCQREAVENGRKLEHHILHLLVHGYLHLFGYDHENDDDALVMETLEIKALAQMGISNPY